MNPKINTRERLYKGCYSCKFFVRENGDNASYGKCIKPLLEAYFVIDWGYIESGTFNYPDRYYPTAGVCSIDDCPNWEDDEKE